MSDFPKPLNEWVEEPVEIATIDPVLNNKGEVVGLKHGKRITTQKTMYSRLSDARRITCNDLEHDWYIPDKHSHVAHCKGCKKRKFIRAIYEKVSNGKIVDRETQQVLA